MDRIQFLKKISDQFLDEDQDKLTNDTAFRKLGTYDSLTGMAIIVSIEEEYKISLPVEDFKKLNTVDELFLYVKDKISGS